VCRSGSEDLVAARPQVIRQGEAHELPFAPTGSGPNPAQTHALAKTDVFTLTVDLISREARSATTEFPRLRAGHCRPALQAGRCVSGAWLPQNG
jgi:hypothetical protein